MSELSAEEDGFFFQIDYQASLANQKIKNPGYAKAQELRSFIRQSSQRINSSAVPLAYYLDILGDKTRELMSSLCSAENGACSLTVDGKPYPLAGSYNPSVLDDSLAILQTLLTKSQQPGFAKNPEGLVLGLNEPIPLLGVNQATGKYWTLAEKGFSTPISVTEAMFAAAQAIDLALTDVAGIQNVPYNANKSINNQSGSSPEGGCGSGTTCDTSSTSNLNPAPGTTMQNGAQQLYNFLLQAMDFGSGSMQNALDPKASTNPFYWNYPQSQQRNCGSKGKSQCPTYTYGDATGVSVGDVATGMQDFSSQSALLGANSTLKQLQALVQAGETLKNETSKLGTYIFKTVCNIGDNICNLPASIGHNSVSNKVMIAANPELGVPKAITEQDIVKSNLKGLMASKNLVQGGLDALTQGVSELYKVSYLPNLQTLKFSQSGDMNGFGTKMGYKQFFGRKRNIGARYYAFLDYGYANFGNGNQQVGANLVTYGAGSDFLYNVFERSRKREKTTLGFFIGGQLAGQSWFTNIVNQINGEKPKTNSSSFQFLFDLGIRTNFSRRDARGHTLHQGIEIGVKIPTIYHRYVHTAGVTASYIRSFSFYIGYTVGF